MLGMDFIISFFLYYSRLKWVLCTLMNWNGFMKLFRLRQLLLAPYIFFPAFYLFYLILFLLLSVLFEAFGKMQWCGTDKKENDGCKKQHLMLQLASNHWIGAKAIRFRWLGHEIRPKRIDPKETFTIILGYCLMQSTITKCIPTILGKTQILHIKLS